MGVRRAYLISYDISDDKRRLYISKTLEDHGDRIQYSVFLCELSDMELARLRSQIRLKVNQNEDQIFILDMGLIDGEYLNLLEFIGRPYMPPVRSMII